MNQILVATIIAVSIIGTGAYAASQVFEMSAASSRSSDIDIEKKSESMNVFFNGSINIINTGKDQSEIAMFRFYDSSGTEVHQVMFPDENGRIFGANSQVVGDNTLTSDDAHLPRHTLQKFSLDDMGIDSLEDITGELVTKRGRTFPISFDERTNQNGVGTGDGTGDGKALTDGLGVYLAIQNIDTNGKVYFGSGDNPGSQTDIRQYVGVGNNDDWAIAVTDDDKINAVVFDVPEFGKKYVHSSGSLYDLSDTVPNILGYSESRILLGDIDITIRPESGISFSGNGEAVIKLDDYTDQDILLRGNSEDGDIIKIVTSDFDLMNDPYPYLLYSGNINAEPNSFSVIAGLDSDHKGVQSFVARAWTYPYHCTNEYLNCVNDWPMSVGTTLVESNNGDHVVITGDSTPLPTSYGRWNYVTNHHNFHYKLTDTMPSYQKSGFNGGIFEELHTFSSETTYVYVKLNGGSSIIKGEAFNPDTDVFFQVYDLPPDVAYDITKDGITGVIGKTSSTNEISLSYDDVDFGIATSPGGILKIYPDSVKSVDSINNVAMIDVYNGYSVSLDRGTNLVYIPQAFVRLVFPVAVEVENVLVDNIPLDDMNKNYAKNEALMIPVIPGAETIYATINEEDVEVLMRYVSAPTQMKQVLKQSSTTSDHATSGTAFATSNISTSTFLTATHTGTMIANIDLKVGASADFSMNSNYVGGFTTYKRCNAYSTNTHSNQCSSRTVPNNPIAISDIDLLTSAHKSQLETALDNGQLSQITVEVDIFKNLQHVKTKSIYTSNSAEAYVTTALSEAGYGASNQVRVTYPLTSISEYVVIPVDVGDMMEFVVRVNLQALGAPTPSSSNAAYSSYVKVTTEFGGGVITVGMS